MEANLLNARQEVEQRGGARFIRLRPRAEPAPPPRRIHPEPQHDHRVTIGVMGSTSHLPKKHLALGFELGRAIGSHDCILITGACHGIPLAAAQGARHEGALVVGVSPGLSMAEHAIKYDSPTQYHDVMVFTGWGLMGREVINIRSSDVVIIAGGHAGTLGELAIAYVEGKLIGILTGMGGLSKIAREVLRVCRKNSGSRVLYDGNPHRLVTRLLTAHYGCPAATPRSKARDRKQIG
jgi:uncharacterized protein (TIGR00725 family)